MVIFGELQSNLHGLLVNWPLEIIDDHSQIIYRCHPFHCKLLTFKLNSDDASSALQFFIPYSQIYTTLYLFVMGTMAECIVF